MRLKHKQANRLHIFHRDGSKALVDPRHLRHDGRFNNSQLPENLVASDFFAQSANGAGAPVNSCSALEHMPAFNNKLRKKGRFCYLIKIEQESHASHTTGSSRTKDSPATSNSQK
ncbi:unnamed protein product, partial [Nesidiocoris tenuis]